MSYALLGNIAFDILHAPTSFDERRSATFAEHQVLSGKPRLQAMGLELTEITLQLRLHHQLGNVESRYAALISAKESQQPLAFVMGMSQFKGHFVITELSGQTLFTDSNGNALAREVSITLREFVGNQSMGLLGEALQLAGQSPLAAILPKGAIAGLNTVKKVTKGIGVYRQTKQVINDVRNVVQLVKTFSHDPTSALLLLPSTLESIGFSLDNLGDMLGLKQSFTPLTQGIAGTANFMRDIGELSGDLNELKTLFKQGFNAQPMESWTIKVDSHLDNLDDITERMATPVAKMTAWIATRSDNLSNEE